MSATGAALEVMPDLIETAASPAVVWVVPKSVPAARLGKALGDSIPADGSRDLIVLTADDGKHAAYPLILAEAIERVDPAAAAHIGGAERDLDTSHMSVRARAVADQAGAAAAHGTRILAAMARAFGGTPAYRVPPPLIREVAERFPPWPQPGRCSPARTCHRPRHSRPSGTRGTPPGSAAPAASPRPPASPAAAKTSTATIAVAAPKPSTPRPCSSPHSPPARPAPSRRAARS